MESNENIKEDYDGIFKNGPWQGHKDHTAGSPYAEDCFVINAGGGEQIAKTLQYNPRRYCAFESLDAFENYNFLNEKIDAMKKSTNIAYKLDKINIMKQVQHKAMRDHPVDEFLDEGVYKTYIDNWIKEVEKSPAKAIKIVLNLHGIEKERFLFMRTSKRFQKKGKKGYVSEPADVRIMNCIYYLLEKISNCSKLKNVNIFCPACYKAKYFATNGPYDYKDDFVKTILIPFSEEMSKKGKKVIYTSNFSEKYEHAKIASVHNVCFNNEINEYSIYDINQKKFVEISPKLEEKDENFYGKYITSNRGNLLQLRYLANIIQSAIDDKALEAKEGKRLLDEITEAIADDRNTKKASDLLNELEKEGFSVDLNSEVSKDYSKFLKKNKLYEIYGTKQFADSIREAKNKKNEILFELKNSNIKFQTENNLKKKSQKDKKCMIF